MGLLLKLDSLALCSTLLPCQYDSSKGKEINKDVCHDKSEASSTMVQVHTCDCTSAKGKSLENLSSYMCMQSRLPLPKHIGVVKTNYLMVVFHSQAFGCFSD